MKVNLDQQHLSEKKTCRERKQAWQAVTAATRHDDFDLSFQDLGAGLTILVVEITLLETLGLSGNNTKVISSTAK